MLPTDPAHQVTGRDPPEDGQLVGLIRAHSVTREAGGVTSVPDAAGRGLTAFQPVLILIYRLFQEHSDRKSRQVLPFM